jgi:multidrug resistance efflux pump
MSDAKRMEFEEATVSRDAIEQMKLGVAVDSAYIRGARWQFTQLQSQIEHAEFCKQALLQKLDEKDKQIAELKSERDQLKSELERHKDLLRKQCNHSQDLKSQVKTLAGGLKKCAWLGHEEDVIPPEAVIARQALKDAGLEGV